MSKPTGQYLIGDCVQVMDTMDPEFVALVCTSPPYNVGIEYAGYDDNRDWLEYFNDLYDFALAAKRVLIPGGRLCVNFPGYAIGNCSGYAHHHAFAASAVRLGYKLYTEIVWDQGFTSRSAWGSFRSASAPRFYSMHEIIQVWAKDDCTRNDRSGETDITANEFTSWTTALWRFHGQVPEKGGHPAPFPPELPKRLIKLLTWPGEIVLDPYAGSGTTLLEAERLKRQWIGIDVSSAYREAFMSSLENLNWHTKTSFV